MIAEIVEYRIASHDNAADMRFRKCGERLLKIGIFARFYDPNLSANSSCGGLDVTPPHICKIDIGIIQVTDSRTSWENLVHKLQTLGFEVSAENGHAGDVATRVIEAGNIDKLYRIAAERNDDRNCFGRSDNGRLRSARRDQDGWVNAHKISGKFRKAIDVLIRPPIFDRD